MNVRAFALLSLILATGAAGCDEPDTQTPCERAAEMKIECQFDGEGHPETFVELCEADYPESWECTIECSKLDDCDMFNDCVDDCH